MVRWTDRPAMTIAVDLGRKATKPTNQHMPALYYLDQALQIHLRNDSLAQCFKICLLGHQKRSEHSMSIVSWIHTEEACWSDFL